MSDEKVALAPALDPRAVVTATNLDPTWARHHQVRDANATDLARQAEVREKKARREFAIVPHAATAAKQAYNMGVPVELVERILALESRVQQLQANFDWLIERKINS